MIDYMSAYLPFLDDALRNLAVIFVSFSVFIAGKRVISLLGAPRTFRIALLGDPGAGKTTLLTAIFESVFANHAKLNVQLNGVDTIRKINRNIQLLQGGFNIPRTTSESVFSYRFGLKRPRFAFYINYDVEVADFPGELSIEITESADFQDRTEEMYLGTEDQDILMFRPEFFNYVSTSDKYVFVIDTAKILSSPSVKNAVANTKSKIRASWQFINNGRDIYSKRGKPSAIIVFTKVDALVVISRSKITISEYSDLIDGRPSAKQRYIDDYEQRLEKCKTAKQLIGELYETKSFDEFELTDSDVNELGAVIIELDSLFSDVWPLFDQDGVNIKRSYVSVLLKTDGGRFSISEVRDRILPH